MSTLDPAWLAPARTAVLAIDMQVDFAAPEGVLGQVGVDLSTVPAALDAAGRLIAEARAAGVAVIFIGLMTSPETDSPAWRERMARRGGDPDQESALCRIGEPGSAFHGPQPLPGEHIVGKARYSSFVGTDLDAHLKAEGIDTVVACGLTTECCIDCTVRDAFHLDYQVLIATDACAAYEPDLHAGSLKVLELNCATLATVDEIAQAWAALPMRKAG